MDTNTYLDTVGNTPLVSIPFDRPNINLFAKLEFYNPTGSIKDRAAHYVINKLLASREIDADTVIIESSSGNFGVALSAYCKKNGLKFICVVDAKISGYNELLIKANGAETVKVTVPDHFGGYLVNRIKEVKRIRSEIENSYWINQYENSYVAEAYCHSVGEEICREMDRIDYVFVAVSSGGTITGISHQVKRVFPHARVVAVDIIGSVVFGGKAQQRHMQGVGSSIVPAILTQALIDEVMIVDELSAMQSCYELINRHQIFAGGSSGVIFEAIKRYFAANACPTGQNVVAIFPDGGEKYTDTIYCEAWYRNFSAKIPVQPKSEPATAF